MQLWHSIMKESIKVSLISDKWFFLTTRMTVGRTDRTSIAIFCVEKVGNPGKSYANTVSTHYSNITNNTSLSLSCNFYFPFCIIIQQTNNNWMSLTPQKQSVMISDIQTVILDCRLVQFLKGLFQIYTKKEYQMHAWNGLF